MKRFRKWIASIPQIFSSPAGDAKAVAFHRFQQRMRVLAAIFFVAMTFIPLVGTIFHWDPIASSENRILARAPEVPQNFAAMTQWSGEFLTYFRDHFAFRNTMMRALSLAKFHSGLALDRNTNIIIGRDGWLFMPFDGDNLLADRNLDPFTAAEVDSWQRKLEQREKFCRDHGIAFIAVIPPDKQSIYPEYLPEQYSQLGSKSRLDQLIDRLRETHSPVHLVDLRPALIEAKKYYRVFHETDAHWNDYGGYAAYPVILDAINQTLRLRMTPQPLTDFIPRVTTHSGDLARYMNLYREYNEDWLQLVRRCPFGPIVHSENRFALMTTMGNPRGPKLFMIHDSFTLCLYQFLGPHFDQACWQWTPVMNGSFILDFKPDIVIDEFLERTLYHSALEDPPFN